MEELLQRLADDSLATVEQGPSIVRALNVLMLKVLENAKCNDAFSVLLQLLRDSSTLMVEMPADTVRPKFAELIMKCLWKLAKARRPTARRARCARTRADVGRRGTPAARGCAGDPRRGRRQQAQH